MAGAGDGGRDRGGPAATLLGVAPGRWPDRVVSVRREGLAVVLTLDGPGAAPATVFVEPVEVAAGHFARSARLAVGYRGQDAHAALLACLEGFVRRLGDLDIEGLCATLGLADAAPESRVDGDQTHGRAGAMDEWPGMHRSWGHPDAWMHFLADAEVSQEGSSSLLFEGDRRLAVTVYHSPYECAHLCPQSFVELPWAPERVSSRDAPKPTLHLYSGLDDLDVVSGGLSKLRSALSAARAVGSPPRPPSMVAVHVGCIPQVTGEDVEAVLAGEREAVSYPVFDMGSRSESSPWRHWVKEVIDAALAAGPVQPEPDAIALAGFRPGPDRDELVREVEAIGLRVVSLPLPAISPAIAARVRLARLAVLSPDRTWEPLYSELISGLGVPALVAPAPYGRQGTAGFIRAIAEACSLSGRPDRGRDPAAAMPDKEAAGVRVGVVCEASKLDRVFDARLRHGVPLVGTLCDLGFDVRVAAAGGGPCAAAGVDRVRSAAELAAWLRESRIATAYTEYSFDARLADAGVAPFGPGVFEMGTAGAVRTARRIIRRARMGLFRQGRAGEAS